MTEPPEIPEEEGEETVQSGSQRIVPSSPYSRIRREISEDDLESPAVQRILLGEVDKLNRKVSELERVEKNYYAADKKGAILEEKLKSVNSHEILYGLTMTAGSVIIGLSSRIWHTGYGWFAVLIGGLLVLGGIASRVVKWRS